MGKMIVFSQLEAEIPMIAVPPHFARLLGEQTFTLSSVGFLALHRRLFEGIHSSAGSFRDYNHISPEWVLGGESVWFTAAEDLEDALNYEFVQERRYNFDSLEVDGVIEHIADFATSLWRIHPFAVGNAVVVAVFVSHYLRFIGFEINSAVFLKNMEYFRNALVRASYRNIRLRISADKRPLVCFLRNVALGEKYRLDNNLLCVGTTPPSPAPAPLHLRQKRLLRTLGSQTLGVPELLKALRLTTRQSFMRVWLTPAMEMGLVKALHPESPRHPQQKYLLTREGQRALKQLTRK